MTPKKLINLIVLFVIVAYLIWMQTEPNGNVMLPFAFGLPPTVVAIIALGIGWSWAWLNDRSEVWAKTREVRRLEKRLAELEQRLPSYDSGYVDRRTPIIPDRTETKAASGKRSVVSEYEDL